MVAAAAAAAAAAVAAVFVGWCVCACVGACVTRGGGALRAYQHADVLPVRG